MDIILSKDQILSKPFADWLLWNPRFYIRNFAQYKELYYSEQRSEKLHEFLGLTYSQLKLYYDDVDGFCILFSHMRRLRKNRKVTLIDGLPYRTRREKLVIIPIQWLGVIPTKKTKRMRKK